MPYSGPDYLSGSSSDASRFQVISIDNDEGFKVREYKKRQAHKKTKLGCKTCKLKRVKCDETRPVCLRCQRTNRACLYEPNSEQSQDLVTDPVVTSTNAIALSSFNAVTAMPSFEPSPREGTSNSHLMFHFRHYWKDILDVARCEDVLSLFQHDPLVRNTILALTACHLRHISPATKSHQIAEHYRQTLALQHYQKALNTPPEKRTQSHANSILLSSALLNMLAFSLPVEESYSGEPDPSTSWVFSQRKDRLGWLSMQPGPMLLMISMFQYLEETKRWLEYVCFEEGSGIRLFTVHHSLDAVPKTWLNIFDVNDPEGDTPFKTFRPLLVITAHLRNRGVGRVNPFGLLQFLCKVHGKFRELLSCKDEKALWLFGYWHGLMCRFETPWWSQARLRRDYEAIRICLEDMKLEERSGDEGEMWREMMEDLRRAPVGVVDHNDE